MDHDESARIGFDHATQNIAWVHTYSIPLTASYLYRWTEQIPVQIERENQKHFLALFVQLFVQHVVHGSRILCCSVLLAGIHVFRISFGSGEGSFGRV